MDLLDSCNGLLLLRCTAVHGSPSPQPPFYSVCNPATGEWVALPQPRDTRGLCRSPYTCSAALGFDPAVSSDFLVFQLVQECYFRDDLFFVTAVEIYSSKTGRWVLLKENNDRWVEFSFSGQMTYFSGFLHFCTVNNVVVSVDTEGLSWRISPVPRDVIYDGSSYNRMQLEVMAVPLLSATLKGACFMRMMIAGRMMPCLSMFLRIKDSEEWTWIFKQSIYKLSLFGPRERWDYNIAAFHPNGDFVFFYDWQQQTLMAYDMKHKDVQAICTLGEVVKVVHDLSCNVHRPFLPYVPLYTRALTSPSVN